MGFYLNKFTFKNKLSQQPVNMSDHIEDEVWDLNKMKMAELKKELQDRGLKVSGNKQELITRLQTYLAEHEGAELEEEDEDDLLNEDVEQSVSENVEEEKSEVVVDKADSEVETPAKVEELEAETAVEEKANGDTNGENADPKPVMTMEDKKAERAKRFGLTTADLSDKERKEQRKKRFGKASVTDDKVEVDQEKLKKRAERFGIKVSSSLVDSEQQEKIRKRKERFGTVTAASSELEI